jgi:succinyl-diaminopimelate desuccinylase
MFDKWVEEHQQEIIAKTQGILQINSVGGPESGPLQPFGPGCAEALEYILNLGKEMGFQVKNLDGYAGHIEWGEGDEYIAVLGHLDVVPVGTGWTHPPFGGEIHDGKIYARGAIDDKGPTMAALYGLKAVKDAGVTLGKKVRVIIGVDEETNWRCMDHYFAHEPKPIGGFAPDAEFPLIYAEKGIMCFDLDKERTDLEKAPVVVRELTGGNRVNMVPDGCRIRLTTSGDPAALVAQINEVATKQQVQVEVDAEGEEILLFVQGVGAHAMVPHTGVNALVQAGKVLQELDTADRDLWTFLAENDPAGERVGVKMTCEVTGPLTSNLGIGKITETHVKLTYNLRFPVDKQDSDLYALLNEKLHPEGFTLSDPGLANMAPLYVPRDSEVVQKLVNVFEKATGMQAELLTSGGGTYARAIPNAVAFGALFPGQEGTEHQADEHWAVDDLLRCTNIYANAIYELAK